MAKKIINGNLRVVIVIVSAVAAIAGSYAVYGAAVRRMEPEVKLNTEHRISDEATDQMILSKMEEVLKAVEKP